MQGLRDVGWVLDFGVDQFDLLSQYPNPERSVHCLALQDMINSGYLSEIHKFSKFIHGCATIFPDLIRAVPYWVDDESVRPSMMASAPSPVMPGTIIDSGLWVRSGKIWGGHRLTG